MNLLRVQPNHGENLVRNALGVVSHHRNIQNTSFSLNISWPRLRLRRADFYGDSCRKNSRHAIFTATVAVTIARSLYLRRHTNSKEGAQSAIHSWPEINFNAQNRKTKTDTNPIPDPNRYRSCPDPNARIQKYYTLCRNTTKEFT